MSEFSIDDGFCSNCGSILPELRHSGDVICATCSKSYPPEAAADTGVTCYTIHFNSRISHVQKNDGNLAGDDGPVVERKCPKCGNEKMSYAAVQLRSADEGQTVFYTCTKCAYKESENS